MSFSKVNFQSDYITCNLRFSDYCKIYVKERDDKFSGTSRVLR